MGATAERLSRRVGLAWRPLSTVGLPTRGPHGGGPLPLVLWVDGGGSATATDMAYIEGSHSGTSQDDKGQIIFKVNDGDDAEKDIPITSVNQQFALKKKTEKFHLK